MSVTILREGPYAVTLKIFPRLPARLDLLTRFESVSCRMSLRHEHARHFPGREATVRELVDESENAERGYEYLTGLERAERVWRERFFRRYRRRVHRSVLNRAAGMQARR